MNLRSKVVRYSTGILVASVILTQQASAADLEGSLRNLVTAFTGRLLPILALGYLGKNIFGHIQGDPNAKQETPRVVIAILCLLGLSSVWSFLSQQVR
jgi:hypothetical protein